jgi:hypothetical protein
MDSPSSGGIRFLVERGRTNMNSELTDLSLLAVFLVSVSQQPLIDTPAAIAQFAE